jgi:Synergist-CTERM protein sorting domain-containing protein
MGKRLWALAALMSGLCLPAQAFVLRTDQSGHPVQWRHQLRFVVDPRLPTQTGEPHAIDAIEASLQSYLSDLPNVKVSLERGTVVGLGYDADGVIDRNSIIMPADWPFQAEAIAVTVVTVDDSSHEIIDADIALNPTHTFRVLPPQGTPGGPDDIQNAVTHELGHAFGLAHNPSDAQAVMYPTASPGETVKRHLSEDDLAGLAELYPGGGLAAQSGCSTAGFAPWALAVIALALLRRRSFARLAPAGLALLLLPAVARAAPSSTPLLFAHVESARTLEPSGQGKLLLFTELTLRTDRCLSGDCPATFTVRVPGGHWSHFEQFVDDSPLPKVGESLGLELAAPDLGSYSLRNARLYRLDEPEQFQSFAEKIASRAPTR